MNIKWKYKSRNFLFLKLYKLTAWCQENASHKTTQATCRAHTKCVKRRRRKTVSPGPFGNSRPPVGLISRTPVLR